MHWPTWRSILCNLNWKKTILIAHMNASNYIASAALIVSVASLAVSIYFSQKDRMNIKAESRYFAGHPDFDRTHLLIRVVNHGRRIAILRMCGGDLEGGGWGATSLGGKHAGISLGEHEFYEQKFYVEEVEYSDPVREAYYNKLWIEDSLGRRHLVKNSEEHIKRLLKEYGHTLT
jgi:hypothetical protein